MNKLICSCEKCDEIKMYTESLAKCPRIGCKAWDPNIITCSTWFYAYGNCKRIITLDGWSYKGTLKELKELKDLFVENKNENYG